MNFYIRYTFNTGFLDPFSNNITLELQRLRCMTPLFTLCMTHVEIVIANRPSVTYALLYLDRISPGLFNLLRINTGI